MKKEKLKRLLNVKIVYIIICFFVIILLICLRNTHAFYNYSTDPIPIFTGKVGNFSGKGDTLPIDKNTDINLMYYIQDITNPKNYTIMEGPPAINWGFKLNEEKSNCIPKDATYEMNGDKVFIVDDNGLVKVVVEQSKPNQVVCRIYYDYGKDLTKEDVIVFALIEDDLGMVIYNGKHYTMSETIPTSGLTYLASSCKNTSIATEIDYTGGKFTFKTEGPNICYAYFNKAS